MIQNRASLSLLLLSATLLLFTFSGCGSKSTFTGGSAVNAGECVKTSTCKIWLRWDPNSETDLAGYQVYFISTNGMITVPPFDHVIDVGNVTTIIIPGFGSGVHYFAVTAYNTSSLESSYSNIVTVDLDAEIAKYMNARAAALSFLKAPSAINPLFNFGSHPYPNPTQIVSASLE